MAHISWLILLKYPSNEIPPEVLKQAESWAKKGLDVAQSARRSLSVKEEICEVVYAMLLFNLGMMREVSVQLLMYWLVLTDSHSSQVIRTRRKLFSTRVWNSLWRLALRKVSLRRKKLSAILGLGLHKGGLVECCHTMNYFLPILN